MFTQSRIFRSAVLALLAGSLAACDGSVRRTGPPTVDFQVVRADAERNRLWVLDPTGLALHDNVNGRRLRHVTLPGLFLAGNNSVCAPDVAVDAAGMVFVSSDVMPVLWRVNPLGFEVTRIDLALDADDDKDVGFTGLSFAGDGIVIAAGTTFGSLWRIELDAARASKVASYPASGSACDPGALLRTARY